jgi:hypothetical protein
MAHERITSGTWQCEAKTRVRKIPLVIHFEPVGLVMLRKSCRLCVVCEMLVAHQDEVERLIDALGHAQASKHEYLVLGTLDVTTWHRGLFSGVSVEEMVGAHGRRGPNSLRRDEVREIP